MNIFGSVRFFCFTLFLIAYHCFYSGIVVHSQTAPVYNRFQYHNYKWKALHTPLFKLYFPRGYDSLASFASVQLPDIMTEAKTAMGMEVKGIPNMVIYPSIDQLYESNIGMHQQDIQTFPTINMKGNRVVLAFDGSFQHFREQLKTAWIRLCWEEQFRNDTEEQLNSKKTTVPYWFKEGCIQYMANGWSIFDEAKMLQFLSKNELSGWETLTEKEPTLLGRGFCYFLTQRYRPDAMMQTLFQMRQGKSLPRALRLVTKQKQDSLNVQCIRFFKERNTFNNTNDITGTDTLTSWLEKTYSGKMFASKYNSDSSALVFILQQHNKRKMFVTPVKNLHDKNLQTKLKSFTHYLLPPWLNDYSSDNYPLLNWNEKGRSFTLTMPVKGKLEMLSFTDQGAPVGRPDILYGIDGVQSVVQWNASQWLLSAYRRGRSDIVSYNANNSRYVPLSKENADHNELFLSRGNGFISYRSGYPADSIYHKDTLTKKYGIYIKEVNSDFKQVADNPETLVAKDSAYVQWHQQDKDNDFHLLNTTSGTIEAITINPDQLPVSNTNFHSETSHWLKDYLRNIRTKDSIKALLAKADNGEVSFLKNVLNPGDTKKAAQMQKDSLRRSVAYTGKKVKPYILQLYSAYFSAQVNNDYFINRFQPYQAYLGTFKFPEVGAMLSGGFSDLLENHHFNIGYRMPAGTEGSDFFVRYENTSKKTDWHILFFRKVESLEPDGGRDWKDNRGNPYPAAAKVKTHYYELGFHTPLHYDWSIDYSLAARRDRTIFLATDRYSLDYEALQSWWGIGNIGIKVHKLRPTIPLLEKGWEGKLLLDGMASTGKQSTMVFGAQLNLGYSQPIIKDITLVVRAQAGYSAGQSKILYNFGGLDNNIVTRVDTSVHFSQAAPFAFQTLVTPFRGYAQNSIYGSQYGLLNLDLYFPVFRSLIPLHTGFSSLNNLQIGLFTDIAKTNTAAGLPPIKTQLTSFGYSLRTMLAGYPIRFDMAWPGNFNKSPVWYLSLTLK
jgi:hypothetical protein